MSLVTVGTSGVPQIQDIMTSVSRHVCEQGGDAIVYPQGTIVVYRNARVAAGSAASPPVETNVAAQAAAPVLVKPQVLTQASAPPARGRLPPAQGATAKEDWRSLGLAASKAHDGSTASQAYHATDSDSATRIKAECQDAGFKLINGVFRAL